jgi:FkbM family methyltransferase
MGSTAALRERIKSTLPPRVTSALKGARSSYRAWRWRMHPLQHILPSGLRVDIKSLSDWAVYNEVFVDGEYDVVIDHVIHQPRTDLWTLDLGANVGMFTLRLMDRWLREDRGGTRQHVVCVEGAPATFRALDKNLDQPPLASVCVRHLGLAGARSGSASISTSAHTGLNSIIDRSAPSLLRVQVPFLDVSTLIPADARIALLKCDIEGAEELFFSNYPDLLRRVDTAVVELHEYLCSRSRCRELLKQAGLERVEILKTYNDADCTLEWFTRAHP